MYLPCMNYFDCWKMAYYSFYCYSYILSITFQVKAKKVLFEVILLRSNNTKVFSFFPSDTNERWDGIISILFLRELRH